MGKPKGRMAQQTLTMPNHAKCEDNSEINNNLNLTSRRVTFVKYGQGKLIFVDVYDSWIYLPKS